MSGRSLIHLQCHFGLDTLSWARRGARVTGLDFSAPAIEAARAVAADTGLDAEFVVAEPLRRPCRARWPALRRRLHRPRRAQLAAGHPAAGRGVVAQLVAPGGFLYLSEFHPITWVFADEDLTVEHDYFQRDPFLFDDPGDLRRPDRGDGPQPHRGVAARRSATWSRR